MSTLDGMDGAQLVKHLSARLAQDGHADVTAGEFQLHLLRLRSFCWWSIEPVRPLGVPAGTGQSRDLAEACAQAVATLEQLGGRAPFVTL